MRSVMLLSGVVVLAATLGYASEKTDDSDATKIRGEWRLVSKTQKGVETKVEAKGDDASDDQPLGVAFEEQSWKAKIGPKGAPIEISGDYTLDSTQTPKLIDITIRNDKDSSDLFGTYKIEKDRLYIRIRDGGGQRPPDFEIPADDCTTLVFRRQPK